MRVRVSDPAATSQLGAFLRARFDAIVDRAEPDELEVSLLGSFSDAALRKELQVAVRRWGLTGPRRVAIVGD